MAVPNLNHLVQAVRDSQAWDFSTKDGLCAYTHAVVIALHRADANFRHLRKKKPKNGCYPDGASEGHAIDAALYVPTGQAVDFIGSAGVGAPNPVSWTLHGEHEYTAADGYAPVGEPSEPSDPAPPPSDPSFELRIQQLEQRLANIANDVETLETVISQNHTRMEAINTAFVEADKKNVKQPLPAASPHTHRLFGSIRTGGPE